MKATDYNACLCSNDACLFKFELRKISVAITTELNKVLEENRVAHATHVNLE